MSPRSYNLMPTMGAPALLTSLDEGAEAGRRHAEERARHGAPVELVTKHPKRHSGVVPPAAERFVQLALVAGFEVKVLEGWATLYAGEVRETKVEAIKVAGIDRAKKRGFQCTWVRGKAGLGIWYERGVGPFGASIGVTAVAAKVNGGELT